jgi:hypothetical protein
MLGKTAGFPASMTFVPLALEFEWPPPGPKVKRPIYSLLFLLLQI